MKKIVFILCTVFALGTSSPQKSYGQNGTGIGITSFTVDPQAMLEIQSTNSGVLIPRMTTAQRTAIAAGTGSDLGLLVYQTDGTAGYYYWDGGVWTRLTNSTSGWGLAGNAGTTAGTNFIGTTDAIDWVIKTSNAERLRISAAGQVAINGSINSTRQLSVTTSTSGNTAIFGVNTSTDAVSTKYGVWGKTSGNNTAGTSYAVYGEKTGDFTGAGYGLYGTASGSSSVNYGVYGTAVGASSNYGVYGDVSVNGGYGVFGRNASTGTGSQYGVYGSKAGATATGTGYGVYGSATGTGSNNHGLYGNASGATNNYGLYVGAGETKISDATNNPTRTANGSISTSNSGGNRIYFRTNNTNYYVDATGTGDYSEYFRSNELALEPGEIASIDPANYNAVQKANASFDDDQRMVGVVSKYGTRNNNDNDGQRHDDKEYVNVGLLGQLQVKISEENGPIVPGDALTLSKTKPGHATKATAAGKIIGYAMTHYPYQQGEITYPMHTGAQGEKDKLTTPHVMAFIQPGFWMPKATAVKQ